MYPTDQLMSVTDALMLDAPVASFNGLNRTAFAPTRAQYRPSRKLPHGAPRTILAIARRAHFEGLLLEGDTRSEGPSHRRREPTRRLFHSLDFPSGSHRVTGHLCESGPHRLLECRDEPIGAGGRKPEHHQSADQEPCGPRNAPHDRMSTSGRCSGDLARQSGGYH
jgi:hypothetical protein